MSTPPDPDSIARRNASLMRRATYASVLVAALLIIIKLIALVMTGSVAILSTLIDSILDGLASLINLFAVRHSLTPADREHRFGHGKAEALAGLAQAAFIFGSSLFLMFEAGQRMVKPQAVEHAGIGIGVVVFSIALTLALVRYQRYVIRRTQSLAISADALHYEGDLFINLGVILSLLLIAWFQWHFVDPLFGMAVALYLLYNAGRIVMSAMDHLMDRELPDADRERIREIALAHPGVVNLHNLRTRSSGHGRFIQIHLEMDGEMSLLDAHAISDGVETDIREAFPNAEIIIHEDPAGLESDRLKDPFP